MTNMDVVVFGSGSVLLDPLSLDPLSWALLLFVFCCCFFSRPIVVGSVVFPALCTCICVLVLCIFVLTHRDIIFDVLEPPAFKKYGTCWVFQALWNCVFLYVQEYLLLSLSSQSVCGYQGSQAFRKYMV